MTFSKQTDRQTRVYWPLF